MQVFTEIHETIFNKLYVCVSVRKRKRKRERENRFKISKESMRLDLIASERES